MTSNQPASAFWAISSEYDIAGTRVDWPMGSLRS